MSGSDNERTERILSTLTDAFEPLMRAEPDAFRTKFRDAQRARRDHAVFVDAFRGGHFDLVSAI